MIVQRYLFREIFSTFSAVTLVVLLVAASNKFVRLIGKAATGEVSADVILQVILFQIPDLLAFLLPIALFLAILLCLSKMFIDAEMPVLFACGFNWQKLLQVTMLMAVLVAGVVGSLTCYWGPKLAAHRETLLQKEGPLFLMKTVSPGKFNSFGDKFVFYVGDINTDRNQWQQLFIAEPFNEANKTRFIIITAKGGYVTNDDYGDTLLTLNDGYRYQRGMNDDAFDETQFSQYQKRIAKPQMQEGLYFHRTMPTQMLWQQPSDSNLAELQWRLSVPLSALILAVLALPLSQVRPRGGRFGKIFLGIVICIVYYNLLTLSKRWLAGGVISPAVGLWWVHVGLLFVSAAWLASASGRLHQLKGWLCHE